MDQKTAQTLVRGDLVRVIANDMYTTQLPMGKVFKVKELSHEPYDTRITVEGLPGKIFYPRRFEKVEDPLKSTVEDAVKNAFDASTLGLLQENVVANVLKALNERHNIR